MTEFNVEMLANLEEFWEKKLEDAKNNTENNITQALEEGRKEYQYIINKAEKEALEKKKNLDKEASDKIKELKKDLKLRSQWLEKVDINKLSEEIFPNILKKMV